MNMNKETQKNIDWKYRRKCRRGEVGPDVLVAINHAKSLVDGTVRERLSFRFLLEVAKKISSKDSILVGACEDRLYFKEDTTNGYRVTSKTSRHDNRGTISIPLLSI